MLRGAANERMIELAVAVVPCAREPRTDPVVFLSGGPGDSATGWTRFDSFLEVVEALRAVADVVLLDQRGTGRSLPALDNRAHGPVLPADLSTRGAMEAFYALHVGRCAERHRNGGVDLAGWTTAESALDLESLRPALGARRLNLLGLSYGTHLALSAIRLLGERSIARAVLCGVEGPDHTYKLPSFIQRQMERLDALCGGGLLQKAAAALERLEREPLRVPVRDPGTGEEGHARIGAYALRHMAAKRAGAALQFRAFPRVFAALSEGDADPLRSWAQDLVDAPFRNSVFYLMDATSNASPERFARIRAEAPGTLLEDAANFPFPGIIGVLGVEPLPEEFRKPVVSKVPVLAVSGTLDANTPPEPAREVLDGFKRRTFIDVQNASHTDLLRPGEALGAIVRFFAGEPVGDRTLVLPPPAFDLIP
jgi:pimeloyl-ACP methyl ester carboxylesterase